MAKKKKKHQTPIKPIETVEDAAVEVEDGRFVEYNVNKALFLADNGAADYYIKLKEDGFYEILFDELVILASQL